MSSRTVPLMVAIGVGVASGIYIWQKPLQQHTSSHGSGGRLDQPLNSEKAAGGVDPSLPAKVDVHKEGTPASADNELKRR